MRLVFTAKAGPALNASMIDLGNRFRLIVNEIDVVDPPEPLPNLPVACAVWQYRPNFKTAAEAWILAGGAHHSGYTNALTVEHLEDFASIAGIEMLIIGKDTRLSEFKNELRWNEIYYHLAQGIGICARYFSLA